jgi:uncharacterized protein YndB with AHSA1/START domain
VPSTTPPAAAQTKNTFDMQCEVKCSIQAPPERVWALLTNAAGFPRWNSTVTRIEGPIEAGRKLVIEVPSAPGRVFKPTVSAFEPGRRMVWSDGMAPMFKGVRTFTLAPGAGGETEFSMVERFSGIMLPLIKGSLPDFGPIFEAYARDLKRAAEGADL